MKFGEHVRDLDAEPAAQRQVAREIRPAVVQRSNYAFFRITPDATGTTTTTTTTTTTAAPGSTTTTTSTTTTSTSTTTQPPCQSRLFFGVMVEVQYDSSPPGFGEPATGVYRNLVVLPRGSEVFPLYVTGRQQLLVHDIVLATLINGQWWVLGKYTNCPQYAVTTTTTTTTTTTSTTTPAPRVWAQ